MGATATATATARRAECSSAQDGASAGARGGGGGGPSLDDAAVVPIADQMEVDAPSSKRQDGDPHAFQGPRAGKKRRKHPPTPFILWEKTQLGPLHKERPHLNGGKARSILGSFSLV